MKNNNRATMKPKLKEKNEKQQSYNNHTTIVQQWKTNETHEWNTTMKHNIEKQHTNTAMTLSNEKQLPYNNESNNEKQEWENNNPTTIIQQSFKNENLWKTRMKHDNETTMKNNI